MITYQDLVTAMQANLDAEFSERYMPEQDYIPAINSAVSRAMTAIGWAMANRDGSEEALRENTYVRIFQTNSQGGVALSDPALVSALGHGVWNVLAVYAEPELVDPSGAPQSLNDNQSKYRDDQAFSGTGQRVERVTLEQVPMIRNNSFMTGNEVLAANPKRRSYSYYIIGNAGATGFNTGTGELRVLPKSITGAKLIAIAYMAEPVTLTAANYQTAQIPLPQSFLRTLADWGLSYISIKQGDGTNLKQTAEQDGMQLFAMATQ